MPPKLVLDGSSSPPSSNNERYRLRRNRPTPSYFRISALDRTPNSK